MSWSQALQVPQSGRVKFAPLLFRSQIAPEQMIPTFPNFKRLSLEDRAEVQAFTECFPPYSDFNFASLWCYDTHAVCRLAKLHGNLVVQMRDYITGQPFLSFLGNERVVETATSLLDYADEQKLSPLLRLVPEAAVLPHRKALEVDFMVEEDRDGFDYIHDVAPLIELHGPALSAKRKGIKRLRREHPQLEISPLNISKPSEAYKMCRLCETWRAQKGRADSEFETERLAIERCLSFAAHFQFLTLGAMIGESLVGFTINETVHGGYYMGHFGKCDPRYSGLSDLLESATARFMRDVGCVRMNNQQDLGLLGLRKYKQSWMPVDLLKKYTIGLRQSGTGKLST